MRSSSLRQSLSRLTPWLFAAAVALQPAVALAAKTNKGGGGGGGEALPDNVAQSLTGQTIPTGSSTYGFNVTVNGDTTPEANQTFFVNVTNVTGATVADGQGLGTIINDDVSLTPIHDIQGPGASSPISRGRIWCSGSRTAG